MLCIYSQHFGSESPVLVELRRKLDEVMVEIGDTLVFHVEQEACKCMSELVEESLGLVCIKQRGLVPYRTAEVAADSDDGSDLVAVGIVFLVAVAAAPCAVALLAGTGEHIHEYDAEAAAVDILALVCFSFGMRQGNVLELFKADSEKSLRNIEDAVTDILIFKERPHRFLVEVIIFGLRQC